jgi:hypothetical protein
MASWMLSKDMKIIREKMKLANIMLTTKSKTRKAGCVAPHVSNPIDAAAFYPSFY